MMNPERTELEWLAFQYIAGELGSDEASAFEARLATDPSACEAVAEAVELAELVSLAENRSVQPVKCQPIGVSKPAWPRSLAWMACGAAACLALILLFQPFGSSLPSSEALAVNAEGQSPELALAWAQTREAITGEDHVDAIELAMAVENENTSDESIDTPSWMVAAVVGLTPSVEEIE